MEELVLSVFQYLMYAVATIAVITIVKLTNKNISVENQKVLKQIVEAGVLFAQQVYWHLDGPERYDKAAEWISNSLKERGFYLSKEKLKGLIESTLKKLKKDFGEHW